MQLNTCCFSRIHNHYQSLPLFGVKRTLIDIAIMTISSLALGGCLYAGTLNVTIATSTTVGVVLASYIVFQVFHYLNNKSKTPNKIPVVEVTIVDSPPVTEAPLKGMTLVKGLKEDVVLDPKNMQSSSSHILFQKDKNHCFLFDLAKKCFISLSFNDSPDLYLSGSLLVSETANKISVEWLLSKNETVEIVKKEGAIKCYKADDSVFYYTLETASGNFDVYSISQNQKKPSKCLTVESSISSFEISGDHLFIITDKILHICKKVKKSWQVERGVGFKGSYSGIHYDPLKSKVYLHTDPKTTNAISIFITDIEKTKKTATSPKKGDVVHSPSKGNLDSVGKTSENTTFEITPSVDDVFSTDLVFANESIFVGSNKGNVYKTDQDGQTTHIALGSPITGIKWCQDQLLVLTEKALFTVAKDFVTISKTPLPESLTPSTLLANSENFFLLSASKTDPGLYEVELGGLDTKTLDHTKEEKKEADSN